MQDFFQRYFDKLDLTTMLERSLDQGDFSFDFVLLFYIAKRCFMRLYEKIVKPSLKFSNRDAGRQRLFRVCWRML